MLPEREAVDDLGDEYLHPLCPQVGGLDAGIVQELLGGPGQGHAARFQHVPAVRALQRLVGVLLREKDRVALPGSAA